MFNVLKLQVGLRKAHPLPTNSRPRRDSTLFADSDIHYARDLNCWCEQAP